jgi:hypothetical protein
VDERSYSGAIAVAQRTAKRIGVLLRARLAEPAAAAGTGTLSHLLLHRLRQTLRALAQGIERAPLRVDGAVGVALAETALRLAHGFSGAAEVVFISPWPRRRLPLRFSAFRSVAPTCCACSRMQSYFCLGGPSLCFFHRIAALEVQRMPRRRVAPA